MIQKIMSFLSFTAREADFLSIQNSNHSTLSEHKSQAFIFWNPPRQKQNNATHQNLYVGLILYRNEMLWKGSVNGKKISQHLS